MAESQDDFWSKPDKDTPRGLWPFRAVLAAAEQGKFAADAMIHRLLDAKHKQRLDIDDLEVLRTIGQDICQDSQRFINDFGDRSHLNTISEQHIAGSSLGVFGTPTVVFGGNHTIFVKMLIPAPEDDWSLFEDLKSMAHRSYLAEVKKPQPPWPGV